MLGWEGHWPCSGDLQYLMATDGRGMDSREGALPQEGGTAELSPERQV